MSTRPTWDAVSTPPARENAEGLVYSREPWRTVGRTELFLYSLVAISPIAPFALFGPVLAASRGMAALVYLVGLLALLLVATSYASMVKAFPQSGGLHTYVGRSLGAPVGFLTGWMLLLAYLLIPTLMYVVAAVAMNAGFGGVPVWVWALVFIAANTAASLRGVRLTAGFIKALIVVELAVLALFLLGGVVALIAGWGNGFSFSAFYNAPDFSWSAVFGGVAIALVSFLGFEGVSMLVEEAEGGPRQVGRAMKLALLIAGVLFAVQVWFGAMLVPNSAELVANGDPGAAAFYSAAEVAGGWLSALSSLATALAWGVAGTMLAQLAVSRLLYAMARDGQLPRLLARVSLRRSVPVNATLAVAVLSTAFTLWAVSDSGNGYGEVFLAGLVGFGALAAFAVVHVSVIVHYMIRNKSRDYPRHAVVPVAGAALLVAVFVHLHHPALRIGGLWFLAGLAILGLQRLGLLRLRPMRLRSMRPRPMRLGPVIFGGRPAKRRPAEEGNPAS